MAIFVRLIDDYLKRRFLPGEPPWRAGVLAISPFGALAVTRVEGGPDSGQELHAHPNSEQAHVIVAGAGTMTVGDEQLDVSPGTAVLVPPGYQHAISNVGDVRLIYVSATAPTFDPWEPLAVGRYASRRCTASGSTQGEPPAEIGRLGTGGQ